jgi:hypothetical protein
VEPLDPFKPPYSIIDPDQPAWHRAMYGPIYIATRPEVDPSHSQSDGSA